MRIQHSQDASGIPMWRNKTTDIAAVPDDAIYKCKVLDVKYINSAVTAKQELAYASSNDTLQVSGVAAARNNPFVQLTLEVRVHYTVISHVLSHVMAVCTSAACKDQYVFYSKCTCTFQIVAGR
jgi:hypothetical protein